MLEGYYARLWKSQWGDDPRVIAAGLKQWINNLSDLKKSEIDRGLAAIAKHPRYKEYVPTPGAFRELCLPSPEDLGWPSFDEAYKIVSRYQWGTHIATYNTYRRLDWNRFCESSRETSHKMFFSVYRDLLDFVRQGGELIPMPTASLSMPPETEEQRDKRMQISKQAIRKIRESIVCA